MSATLTGPRRVPTGKRQRPMLRLLEAPAAAKPQKARREDLDALGRSDASRLAVLTASISAFGLVIVLSASSVVSIATYGSPWSLFERQVMWTALGVLAFLFCARIQLAKLRRLSTAAVLMSSFLLLAVLAPGIGKIAGGSSRWIGAGPIRIQPSELAKLAFVLFCADLVARRERADDQWQQIVRPVALVLAFLAILIVKQPDLGTAIVLICIASSVLYAGGVRWRLLAAVMGVIFAAGSVLALSASYRRDRLLSFINPFAHASTTGYQVVQSLAALGSGHLTGTGLGGSSVTWGLLPNAQTDFIFAVIGNELGLVGAIAVLVFFGALGVLGLRIAARAEDRFAALLACGITCWLVCQAFINIGGVIGVLPETGIPLPFLSFGGSSLVVALASVGLLHNISRHRSLPNAASAPSAKWPSAKKRTIGRQRPSSSRRPSTTPSAQSRSANQRNVASSGSVSAKAARPARSKGRTVTDGSSEASRRGALFGR